TIISKGIFPLIKGNQYNHCVTNYKNHHMVLKGEMYMNNIPCPRCGASRSTIKSQPCPNCGARSYLFNLYLYPGEARGLIVAVYILVTTILLVAAGLAAMHQIYKIIPL